MLRQTQALRRFHIWRQALRSRRLNPHPPGAMVPTANIP